MRTVRRNFDPLLRAVLTAAALAWPAGRAGAEALPGVDGVEFQPLSAQARRVAEAMEVLGQPLPPDARARLERASAMTDGPAGVRAIQEALDPLCLVGVGINPESRVKASQGPAPARLTQHGWRVFLVKVHNEAGVTAPLLAGSPNAAPLYKRSTNSPEPKTGVPASEVPHRWMDVSVYGDRPLTRTLSGLALEYRVIQIYSRDGGRREARISFNVGQGTQDLGFRGDVDVLFACEPAVPLVLDVRDFDGRPAMASFLIRDALGRVYPSPTRRLAPDFFFHPQVYRQSGESVLLPPGTYTVEWTRGPEYVTRRRTVTVPPAKEHRESFALERWAHLAGRNWFSGDHHVHAAGCAHYESPTEGVTPNDMMRHILGEDLGVGCVLSWGPCWYAQKAYFDGMLSPLSTPDHLMRYDVEVSGFPSSHAGHLCLLRLKEDDYPGTTRIEEWPSWDLPVLKWGKSQGGVVGFAHSGWGLKTVATGLPNDEVPPFDGIGANARYEGGDGRAYLLRMGHFPAARAALPIAIRRDRRVTALFPEASGEPAPMGIGPVFDPGGFFAGCFRPGDDAPAWVSMRTTELEPTAEVEPDDAPERATRATVPSFLYGRLASRGESDWFAFELVRGQAIAVKAEGREVGSPADLELTLLDPAGNEARRVDDLLLDDAAFLFTANADGVHRLRVRDVTGGCGPDFVYGVEVRADVPRFAVASDVAALTVPRGGTQPIPLTVTRSNYDGPIALAIEGRPPGLALRPAVIPAGASQAVVFLEADASCPAGLSTVRIGADAGKGVLPTLAGTQPLIDRQAVNVDLIKTALREDQRCLPPSLRDRVALLVTPPAPFSFDLPEPAVDLARFQHAEFPIVVRREPGFTAPVSFQARGGPIGDKAELRVQVYAEIPQSAPGAEKVTGILRSRNLAQTAVTLVSIDATSRHEGRQVTLTRTFLLDLKPAFAVAPVPARIALKPGATARIRVKVHRLRTFDGPVTVTPTKAPGVVLPESVEVPAGRPEVEVELKIEPGTNPGTLRIGFPALARVSGFEEEARGPDLTIEVQKP